MNDLISRQAAIEALEKIDCSDGVGISSLKCDAVDDAVTAIKALPSAQPNTDLQNLAEEIAAFKRSFKSTNSDYLTGYLSALSLVEGMIAERRGEQDG